ncbi:TonB-linked outer membrane protein, SusC/RagA family [Pedobacter westerhofensis]|uniref:TonB-linked outer membrane protein, SusC/RagA family n=1 Tax=Pedobacter westerhofensis TaxID=425512 RepID=A0A521C0N2_9SPHI|nr:TonB-dependent receptor [Pedobacter westerhofensis]SMO52361.1 TonB-linked outer membrane protein, SusC/RagA family [Pedobacter westerhofensis]
MNRIFTPFKLRKNLNYVKKSLPATSLISAIIFIVLVPGEARSAEHSRKNTRELAYLPINHFTFQQPALQQIEVKGKVTDAKGAAIPGVSVKVKDTSIASVTDVNGEYRIRVANTQVKLLFSYTGFVTQEKDLTNGTSLNIVLTEDNKNLTEVVVVGYGQQRKATVTGAIARANLESFRDAPNTNIGQSLQGAVAGLNVGPVTEAGNTPTIRVRGQNTLGGNQNALIILDGIQYNGNLSAINPDDIESIDVLKDASSTAVYGAQAANGVLLVTSRKGKGEPRINFTTSYATQTPTADLRPMTRAEDLEYIKALDFTKSYTNPAYVQPDIVVIADGGIKNANGLLPNDFNWYDAGTNRGSIKDYGLSISGASEKINYLISGNYTNQSGYIINDQFKRKSARVNLESKVTDWLTVGVQTFAAFNNEDGAQPDRTTLFRTSPLLVPYDASGNLIVQPYSTSQDINPFSTSDIDNFDRHNFYFANLYSQVKIPFIDGLSYRINFGNNGRTDNLYIANPYGASQTGSVSKAVEQYYDYTLDNILTYNKKINKHGITGTLLYGAIERRDETTQANATGFTRLTLGYNNIGLGTVQTVTSGGYRESLNYQMARVNYTYDDKYIFTGTVRRDGFSAFSENNKFAVFPSASLGWIVTDEPFFKIPAIQYLKIRAGYGISGNQVQRYRSLDQVRASGYTYIFGDGNSNTLFGQRLSNLGNPNLRWEKTREVNIGADFTLFKGRLSGALDVYSRKTKDLLFNVNIPNVTGFETITSNIGAVSNKGIELTLTSTNISSGGFKWNTTFNFSRNVNKITELLGNGDLVNSNLFIGHSINSFYDYRYNGIYGLNETIPTGYYPGTRRVLDNNGDGVINTADRVIVGSSDPAFRFSVLNSFEYKNFTFSFFINSIQGGSDGYLGDNSLSLILNDNNIRYNNIAGIDWWSPSNPNGEYPRSQVSPTINPRYFRSRSFVRLQDITLSYKFPQQMLKSVHMKNLSVFASGKNLYTWTDWKGWDPEIADGGLNMGGKPLLKGVSIGLNVTF